MNLIEHYVEEVLDTPEAHVTDNGITYYTVKCKVNCYGQKSVEKVFAHTWDEAISIKAGFMYLA